MKHIVRQMLRAVSVGKPSLVLYSGHDHTLEQLAAALGLANNPLLLRYAARLIFEVYEDLGEERGNVYFRLV